MVIISATCTVGILSMSTGPFTDVQKHIWARIATSIPTYSYYPYLLLLSLPAPTIPTCSYYPYLLLLCLPAPTIPTCSYYPYLLLLSLPAPTIPTCSYYPYLLLLSLPAPTIPTCSYYPYLLLLSLPALTSAQDGLDTLQLTLVVFFCHQLPEIIHVENR